MNNTYENVSDQLEEILQTSRDEVKGYGKAAENTTDMKLKAYFENKATKRENYNGNLKSTMVENFGDFEMCGTFKDTLHRA